MDWWLIGVILVVGYLGLQNFGHLVRWKGAIQAFSAMTEMLGAVAEMPKEEIQKAQSKWDEARITAAQQTTAGAIVLLAIVIFLIALGVHGKV